MTAAEFKLIVTIWILLAIILFPLLIKVKAPYGRHSKASWGPMLDNRTGWILMELPALLLFAALFLSGKLPFPDIRWIFFGLWVMHYLNRVFVFPLRTRTKGKKMPAVIMLLAMIFNLVNAFINAYWLGYTDHLQQSFDDRAGNIARPEYYADWFTDWRFLAGIFLFITGFIINQLADNHLINLRNKKQGTYSIPSHKLFKYVSCPNFGGEILEWTGFAIMTWSLPGLSFAIWTAANLIPRALHHHSWYLSKFKDYPKTRKAVIPGIL